MHLQLSSAMWLLSCSSLRWRNNERYGVSNHQPHDYLLSRLFRRRSKKTLKLRITGLCAGNSPVNSLHKGPVTRKMFPFDDVIMFGEYFLLYSRDKTRSGWTRSHRNVHFGKSRTHRGMVKWSQQFTSYKIHQSLAHTVFYLKST